MFWNEADRQASNPFAKARVFEACYYTLHKISASREREREDLVEHEMGKKKFFLGPRFSRTEAEARVKTGGLFSPWSLVDLSYTSTEGVAKEVLRVALESEGDTVWLKRDEASRLIWPAERINNSDLNDLLDEATEKAIEED